MFSDKETIGLALTETLASAPELYFCKRVMAFDNKDAQLALGDMLGIHDKDGKLILAEYQGYVSWLDLCALRIKDLGAGFEEGAVVHFEYRVATQEDQQQELKEEEVVELCVLQTQDEDASALDLEQESRTKLLTSEDSSCKKRKQFFSDAEEQIDEKKKAGEEEDVVQVGERREEGEDDAEDADSINSAHDCDSCNSSSDEGEKEEEEDEGQLNSSNEEKKEQED